MSNVRRWYTYIVSAITLQAVAWAIIALLRNLLTFGIDPFAVAFQVAVIIVGLPLFLVHWLWVQRLALKDFEERGDTLRRLYLYGSLAAFLGPFVANGYNLIRRLLGGISPYLSYEYSHLSSGGAAVYHMIALIVLAVLWSYHYRVAMGDSSTIPEVGGPATVRRLYILGFSGTGMIMTTLAVINLLRWFMMGFGGSSFWRPYLTVGLTDELSRLVIGLLLWVLFWRWAQQLFFGPSEEEQRSALRKFYLFGAIFASALAAVTNTAGILAGIFRRFLDLPSEGDIRQPLPIIISAGILWLYHTLVLRDEAQRVEEAPRQAGVRRLYYYLIAAVGLSALLVGLSGEISIFLRSLGSTFGEGLREEFAWYSAAIIAGLPVWVIPWRLANGEAESPDSTDADARRSVVRKIYLYFFIFVATMTVLSSAVFIIYRILSLILAQDPLTLIEMVYALAYSLIAVAVWIFHGRTLRNDGRLAQADRARNLDALRVVVLDLHEGLFGVALIDELKREFPTLNLTPIVLAPEDTAATVMDVKQENIEAEIQNAGLIIGPWAIAVGGGGDGAVSTRIAQAVVSSSARKLLVPSWSDGWDWIGVDRWKSDAMVAQAAHAVKQVFAGEDVKARRPMSIGAIVGIVIGVLFLLILLGIPLLYYFI